MPSALVRDRIGNLAYRRPGEPRGRIWATNDRTLPAPHLPCSPGALPTAASGRNPPRISDTEQVMPAAAPHSRLPTRRLATGGRALPYGQVEPTAQPGTGLILGSLACHSQQSLAVPSDNHGERQSSIDLHGFTPPQVTILPDLALQAGGHEGPSNALNWTTLRALPRSLQLVCWQSAGKRRRSRVPGRRLCWWA